MKEFRIPEKTIKLTEKELKCLLKCKFDEDDICCQFDNETQSKLVSKEILAIVVTSWGYQETGYYLTSTGKEILNSLDLENKKDCKDGQDSGDTGKCSECGRTYIHGAR